MMAYERITRNGRWLLRHVVPPALVVAALAGVQVLHGQQPPRTGVAPATPPGQQIAPRQRSAATPAPRGGEKQLPPLEQMTWRRLVDRIETLLRRPVPVEAGDAGGQASVTLPAAAGGQVRLAIDRDSGRMTLSGTPAATDAWARVIRALDRPAADPQQAQLVTLRNARAAQVRRAVALMQSSRGDETAGVAQRPAWASALTATMLQLADDADDGAADPFADDPPPDPAAADDVAEPDDTVAAVEQPGPEGLDAEGALIGPVRIEYVEGLDIIVVRGHKRDVERVMRIIEQIERLSADTEPSIELLPLEFVDSEAMAQMVINLYEQMLSSRQGRVSITPLVKPNALLLIGRPESTAVVTDLVQRLDKPVPATSQFHVFQLKNIIAEQAAVVVQEFYGQRGGLGMRVNVVPEFRSNALIVQASPRDLIELARLIEQIDVAQSEAVNEVRVFKLQNSLAEELAPVLEESLTGRRRTGGFGAGAAGGAAQQRDEELRSTMLTLLTLDAENKQLLKSGIMADVRVTGDARTNSLVVTAPGDSMDLIAALVDQLDRLPTDEAQIKVFTIVNGDAVSLAEMLQELFGQQTAQTGQPAVQTGSASDTSLVPLRFSVDARTNSIIASGAGADLTVVEAILLRLDEDDMRQRESVVIRLSNSPAADVAQAINDFLRSERQVEQIAPEAVSPFEQIEREVVVVPEPVTNSLIISATPRYFEEIKELVDTLDERPPMVLIQVLIAEVALGDIEEFGVELGLQDSLLFDRGVVTDVVTPGFNFNGNAPGNSSDADSLATRDSVAGQVLSNFATGRANAELGYGGLVLSAGSESVSVLLRALQEDRRLSILSRPQVMTLDNQSAFIQIGSQVPRITSSQQTVNGTINNTTLDDVGIILGVTPRISPDGMVVMEIDAVKSSLGPIDEGIPISINENGDVIRSPQIDTTRALTTVSARDGQTVILGGLITEDENTSRRKVPYLGDLPLVGALFRFDRREMVRTELLIIMTPFVVESDADVEWTKQVEAERISWCLADVACIHGDIGLREGFDPSHGDTDVIYPDLQPAVEPPEPIQPLGQFPSSGLQPAGSVDAAAPVAPSAPKSTIEFHRMPTAPRGESAWPAEQGVRRASYQPIEPAPLPQPASPAAAAVRLPPVGP